MRSWTVYSTTDPSKSLLRQMAFNEHELRSIYSWVGAIKFMAWNLISCVCKSQGKCFCRQYLYARRLTNSLSAVPRETYTGILLMAVSCCSPHRFSLCGRQAYLDRS